MKGKFKKITDKVKDWSSRYLLLVVIIVFSVWLVFFDEFNLVDRFEKESELHELRENEKYYEEQIREDSIRLNELMSGKEELEKFAREQYYMKEADEDIFLVIPEE